MRLWFGSYRAIRLAAALWTLVGCQSYSARPIDIAEVVRHWQTREPTRSVLAKAQPNTQDAFNPNDGLNVDEGVAVALVFNPQIGALRQQAAIELAGVSDAGHWPNPELGVDVKRVTDNVSEPWRVTTSLGVSIPLSGRVGATQGLAQTRAQASRLDTLAAEWRLVEQVRQTWVTWSAAEQRARIIERHSTAMAPIYRAAAELAKAGELQANQLGVLSLDQLERIEEATEAKAHANHMKQSLLALMGLRPHWPGTLQPSLSVPTVKANPNSDAKNIRSKHPLVRAALAQYQVAENALRREISKQYPHLVVGPSAELDAGKPWIGLGLGLALPSLDLNRRGIARAIARRRAVEAKITATLSELLATTQTTRSQISRANKRKERLSKTLVPAVEARLLELSHLAQSGEIDPLLTRHLLDRARHLNLALLDAKSELAVATLTLHGLVMAPSPMRGPKETP